ncbi:olfactory receptor 6N2-like [Rhinoderma darwinii]|uniref:olfactory receptor 6N2-like n=1 Tax=Rhinoderma darwinii TaxID=43563 RepID=UPI003F67235A
MILKELRLKHRKKMYHNQSVSEFIIVGFTNIRHFRHLTFTFLLLLFVIIIVSNIVVLFAVVFDFRLHKPMYYFIFALSVAEIGIVITVYPTLLTLVLKGNVYISFNCCFIQMYIFHSLVITENFLLSAMAYDRYIAICKALQYHTIMTLKSCKRLIILCCILGFITPLSLLIMVSRLPFCGPNTIQHLFCDSTPLLTLACADNYINVMLDLMISSCTITLTSFSIFVTYINILGSLLKMKTSKERKKAFSTCASHLIMAFIFYGSIAFMYIELQTNYSSEYDLAIAIHHSVLTPLLSPLIYIFRNREILNFLKRSFYSKRTFIRNISISSVFDRKTSNGS